MKRCIRFIRWALWNFGLAWLAWLAAACGSEGAGRLLMFSSWLCLCIVMLVSTNKEACEKIRARGRSAPASLSHLIGLSLVAFLVWHGWYFTAIALLLTEIFDQHIFHNAEHIHGDEDA